MAKFTCAISWQNDTLVSICIKTTAQSSVGYGTADNKPCQNPLDSTFLLQTIRVTDHSSQSTAFDLHKEIFFSIIHPLNLTMVVTSRFPSNTYPLNLAWNMVKTKRQMQYYFVYFPSQLFQKNYFYTGIIVVEGVTSKCALQLTGHDTFNHPPIRQLGCFQGVSFGPVCCCANLATASFIVRTSSGHTTPSPRAQMYHNCYSSVGRYLDSLPFFAIVNSHL
jgi:hypothetical protein